ncbi:hypothetical protein BSKO_01780 [Bryopsis sp. KO-2023]|nr:hypothetical protein BSKO_01780 [Bryopsis sp. KO-2023]
MAHMQMVVILGLLFSSGALAGRSFDSILDRCQSRGREVGKKAVAEACFEVTKRCDPVEFSAKFATASLDIRDAVKKIVGKTCDVLFHNECVGSAIADIYNTGNQECIDILTQGPQPRHGCRDTNDAFQIFENALSECRSPCACSSDGHVDGVRTGRGGCKQHLRHKGDHDFFCYVVDHHACLTSKVTEEVTAGAYWKICDPSRE